APLEEGDRLREEADGGRDVRVQCHPRQHYLGAVESGVISQPARLLHRLLCLGSDERSIVGYGEPTGHRRRPNGQPRPDTLHQAEDLACPVPTLPAPPGVLPERRDRDEQLQCQIWLVATDHSNAACRSSTSAWMRPIHSCCARPRRWLAALAVRSTK